MINEEIKFMPNRWVKCIYKGHICLGRTFFYEKPGKSKSQMISMVCETGEQQLVAYSLVRKVVILKILTVTEFKDEFSICKKVKKLKGLNMLNQTLAQYQLKTSMS